MRLSQEESRALAFIAAMIALALLGRWVDRPRPLSTDLAAVNLDSFRVASEAALPRRGTKGKATTKTAKPPKAPRPPKTPKLKAPAPHRDVVGVITHITAVEPTHGSPSNAVKAYTRATKSAEALTPVNINRATAAELERLPRVGPVLAARIVAYREANGSFANVESLTGVKGVGPAMLERLRPYVRAP